MAKSNKRRPNLSRISRLLQVIGHLQSGRGHNTASLAQACDVSRRTIFRDLEALRESGVPLAYDEERQLYHIPGTYFLPPTHFSAEEALAVIVLCHEMGSGAVPYFSHAQRAAVKLENALPAQLRDHLRSVAGAVRFRAYATSRTNGNADVYEQLLDAISRKQCVRMQYDSIHDGKSISTRLSPYQLLFSRHSWYVIGRSSFHRSTRTFHVGRIDSLDPLQDRFTVPRGFNLRRYLKNAWNLIPEPGDDSQVVVRFSPKVARNVAQVLWHPTQEIEHREDGSLEFRATVSGLDEISWWIMGYGDQAEVIEPKELRQKIAERAKNLVSTYRV